MTTRDYVAYEADLPRGTLCDLFLGAVDRFGDAAAFRYFEKGTDRLVDISYREALETATSVVGGLRSMGLDRGDRAAILSENRPEWALADYGCILGGVVPVPVYPTLTAEQIAYILRDSGTRVVFASDSEQTAKALEACRACDEDVRVVVFDDVAGGREHALDWSRFLATGRERMASVPEDELRSTAAKARPEDVATILYTSGTTGPPKGVMLTHQNLFSNVVASSRVLPIGAEDLTLSFLPLSHVLQRMVDYLLLSQGCTIAYAHDIRTVADDLKRVRPTIVVSVPRLYEKVYNKVMEAQGAKKKIVGWAVEVGRQWADRKLAGGTPGPWLAARYAVADRLVFKKIRAGVGGRLRFFVSGGAPLEPAIARFFYAARVTILEGYGLTETSPVTNVNTPDRFKIGTVGPPVPGTEIRIAADGEILVRGPQVMKGYYNRPDATAEVIDGDGWFHTGDIGEIDGDGMLKITDRKKDLIVTAGGKNVAPQPIENRLKANAFVEQAVLLGDRRQFIALLVVPSFPQLEAWATAQGLRLGGRKELLRHVDVQDHLESEIFGALGGLARFEMPKKVTLLEEEFTVEDGSLTPTQKVKRRVVEERHAELIERMFADDDRDRRIFVA